METDLETLIREFTELRVWAVVGVSTNPEKFGHKIFRSLRAAGYRVYGVNPVGGEIDGERLYSDLCALPEIPQVVDIVVPPQITEQVARRCAELGVRNVWMQPGSESDTAIQYCHEHGIRVVHDACAMVRARSWD